MPFSKVGPDKYVSPSGKSFNAAQVRLYYAHGGSFPGQKKNEPKAKSARKVHYAPLSLAPPSRKD